MGESFTVQQDLSGATRVVPYIGTDGMVALVNLPGGRRQPGALQLRNMLRAQARNRNPPIQEVNQQAVRVAGQAAYMYHAAAVGPGINPPLGYPDPRPPRPPGGGGAGGGAGGGPRARARRTNAQLAAALASGAAAGAVGAVGAAAGAAVAAAPYAYAAASAVASGVSMLVSMVSSRLGGRGAATAPPGVATANGGLGGLGNNAQGPQRSNNVAYLPGANGPELPFEQGVRAAVVAYAEAASFGARISLLADRAGYGKTEPARGAQKLHALSLRLMRNGRFNDARDYAEASKTSMRVLRDTMETENTASYQRALNSPDVQRELMEVADQGLRNAFHYANIVLRKDAEVARQLDDSSFGVLLSEILQIAGGGEEGQLDLGAGGYSQAVQQLIDIDDSDARTAALGSNGGAVHNELDGDTEDGLSPEARQERELGGGAEETKGGEEETKEESKGDDTDGDDPEFKDASPSAEARKAAAVAAMEQGDADDEGERAATPPLRTPLRPNANAAPEVGYQTPTALSIVARAAAPAPTAAPKPSGLNRKARRAASFGASAAAADSATATTPESRGARLDRIGRDVFDRLQRMTFLRGMLMSDSDADEGTEPIQQSEIVKMSDEFSAHMRRLYSDLLSLQPYRHSGDAVEVQVVKRLGDLVSKNLLGAMMSSRLPFLTDDARADFEALHKHLGDVARDDGGESFVMRSGSAGSAAAAIAAMGGGQPLDLNPVVSTTMHSGSRGPGVAMTEGPLGSQTSIGNAASAAQSEVAEGQEEADVLTTNPKPAMSGRGLIASPEGIRPRGVQARLDADRKEIDDAIAFAEGDATKVEVVRRYATLLGRRGNAAIPSHQKDDLAALRQRSWRLFVSDINTLFDSKYPPKAPSKRRK